MKRVIIILFILLLAPCIQAQNLQDYLKLAVDSNPGLRARYVEFEAAVQKIPQSRSLPDPTVSMSAFGQMIETRVGPQRAVIILNQMFPWFGTLKASSNVMASNAEAKFQTWIEARNELLFKVKSAWYPLYELELVTKYQEENRIILQTYKTLAETAYKNGKGAMVDIIRADIMLEDIVTELTLLADKRKPLLAQFNSLLNRDIGDEIITDSILTPINTTSEFSMDSMLQNNPRLAELNMRSEVWRQQAIVAKKQGMPKFGVGVNYTIIGQRTDVNIPENGKDVIMPMLSVSLPLYRNKYKAAIDESRLMLASVEYMKQETKNDLLTSYTNALYESEKAAQEYKLFSAQITRTQQTINLLLTSYSNSGKDFEEVLRMQQLLLKYKIAMAGSTKSYFTAVAKLEYLTAKN